MSDQRRKHPPPCRAAWLSVAFIALCAAPVFAHDVSRSESTITIDEATVRIRFAINLLELSGVDANGDERVSYDELDARIEEVFAAIKQHFELRAPDPPERVVMERHRIVEDHMLQADLEYRFADDVRELAVGSSLDTVTGPSHLHHVRAEESGINDEKHDRHAERQG